MFACMCARIGLYVGAYVCMRVCVRESILCVLYLFLGIFCTALRQSKLLWVSRERGRVQRARGAVKGFYRGVGKRVVKGEGKAVELVSNGFLCGNQHRIVSDVVRADMCGWLWQTSPTLSTLSLPPFCFRLLPCLANISRNVFRAS